MSPPSCGISRTEGINGTHPARAIYTVISIRGRQVGGKGRVVGRSGREAALGTEEQSGQLGQSLTIGQIGQSWSRAAVADGDGNGNSAATQRVGRSETGARPAKKVCGVFCEGVAVKYARIEQAPGGGLVPIVALRPRPSPPLAHEEWA